MEQGGDTARYRLLEPVRQYATQVLTAAEEADPTRARHAAWYVDRAERMAPALRGPAQVAWLDQAEIEQDNLRAALHWTERTGAVERGARLAVALTRYWESRGAWSEGRRAFQAILDRPESATLPPALRARLLLGAAQLAYWQDLDATLALLDQSVELAKAAGAQLILAEALTWLGATLRRRRAFERAAEVLDQALALSVALDDRAAMAYAYLVVAFNTSNLGDAAGVRRCFELALACYLEVGDLRGIATARTMLGFLLATSDDLAEGGRLLREGIVGLCEVGDRAFILTAIWALAMVEARSGRPDVAARLVDVEIAIRLDLGAALTPINESTRADVIAAIRPHMSEAAFAAAVADGEALSPAAAIAHVLDVATSPGHQR